MHIHMHDRVQCIREETESPMRRPCSLYMTYLVYCTCTVYKTQYTKKEIYIVHVQVDTGGIWEKEGETYVTLGM